MLNTKIKNLSQLKKIIRRQKLKGKTIVFTNGCFDILHYGHIKYLEEAKKRGDILIVGVNSDTSVRKIKGRLRPLVNEKDRISIIAALKSVDYAVLFNESAPLKLIKSLKPDILIKGGDWNKKTIVGGNFVSNYGGRVETINLIKGRSTTNLIKKIAQRF